MLFQLWFFSYSYSYSYLIYDFSVKVIVTVNWNQIFQFQLFFLFFSYSFSYFSLFFSYSISYFFHKSWLMTHWPQVFWTVTRNIYAANQCDLTYCRFTLRKTRRSRLTLALFRQLACHTRGFQRPCQQRCEHNIDFCRLRLRKQNVPTRHFLLFDHYLA